MIKFGANERRKQREQMERETSFMEERRRIEEDITLVSFKCHACK
jgi:hypothetical protein